MSDAPSLGRAGGGKTLTQVREQRRRLNVQNERDYRSGKISEGTYWNNKSLMRTATRRMEIQGYRNAYNALARGVSQREVTRTITGTNSTFPNFGSFKANRRKYRDYVNNSIKIGNGLYGMNLKRVR